MSTRQSLDVPGTYNEQAHVPAHAAATATEIVPIFEAPAAVKIEKVKIIPAAAITGADTNTTHVNLLNLGANGAGVTELAAKDYVSGVNSTIAQTHELYAPASPLAIAAGVKLGIELQKVGTGLALPAFLVVVEFSPN